MSKKKKKSRPERAEAAKKDGSLQSPEAGEKAAKPSSGAAAALGEITHEVARIEEEENRAAIEELKKAALEAEPDEVWTAAEDEPPSENIPEKAAEPTGDTPTGDTEGEEARKTGEELPSKSLEQELYKDVDSGRVSTYDRNNEISFEALHSAEGKASGGPPVSQAELARREAALDALDRDLSSARAKKLAEDEELRHREEERVRREKERHEKAVLAQQRRKEAEERSRQREQALREKQDQAEEKNRGGKISRTSETGAVSHGTAKVRKNAVKRSYNSELAGMGAVRGILIAFVIIAGLYIAAFIYSGRKAAVFYGDMGRELTALNRLVTDESIPYKMPDMADLSLQEKDTLDLHPGAADSDGDGLDDRYELANNTDPKREDTDNDGLSDGMEVKTGLDPTNPMTDGVTKDSLVIGSTTISGEDVTVVIRDISKAAAVTLTPVKNYTLNGTPGMIGGAYEFNSNMSYTDAVMTFKYDEAAVSEKGLSTDELAIFRYDPKKMRFEQLPSEHSSQNKTVSCHVNMNGTYALFDAPVAMDKGKTQVFFLFDNSGSMYPQEVCPGSEENDVDFKRLDMALNLIDMLGEPVRFGAGEFSGAGSYKRTVEISSDIEKVKSKIDNIRTQPFSSNGTQISEALEHALLEFGEIDRSDRNYVVLLTDGMPTKMEIDRDKKVIAEAKQKNITVFTIGLGRAINTEYLINFASSTNGQFFQATNADALENIYEKIKNFMSYNQVVVNEETGETGFIIGDSGFDVQRDGFGYTNFRSDFAPNGADVGIAGLICDYYSGALGLTGKPFRTDGNENIYGYNISTNEGLSTGKLSLHDIHVDILDKYNEYLKIDDKWDWNHVNSTGLLRFNDKTRSFIEKSGFRITTANYNFTVPEQSGFDKFLAAITNHTMRPFTSYECVLIDSNLCEGEDLEVMRMINWYCKLPESVDKNMKIYDFGYQGDLAMDTLVYELTNGSPVVITYGSNALNAIRLTRDNTDPDSFILVAYDSNSPEREVKINLKRSALYTWEYSEYQYLASRNGQIEPLRIMVLEDSN